jgi:hypothetical protein
MFGIAKMERQDLYSVWAGYGVQTYEQQGTQAFDAETNVAAQQ